MQCDVLLAELTERPFEVLGSQSERDRDVEAESHDTADSQAKSGLVANSLPPLL